jgi:transposase
VLAKRLEKGRFAAPWAKKKPLLEWTTSELALFLEGSELVGRIPLSPPAWAPHERRVVFR